MYQHITSQWIEKLPAVSPKMAISAKILGIMRTLLVYGYERPGEQIDVQGFFDLSVQHLRQFYPLCISHSSIFGVPWPIGVGIVAVAVTIEMTLVLTK